MLGVCRVCRDRAQCFPLLIRLASIGAWGVGVRSVHRVRIHRHGALARAGFPALSQSHSMHGRAITCVVSPLSMHALAGRCSPAWALHSLCLPCFEGLCPFLLLPLLPDIINTLPGLIVLLLIPHAQGLQTQRDTQPAECRSTPSRAHATKNDLKPQQQRKRNIALTCSSPRQTC